MIFDSLANHATYDALHPQFKRAFAYIENFDPATPPGRYELEDGMYVLIQAFETRPVEGALFEAHKKYIDIQFVREGRERMDYAPVTALEAGEYQAEKDYIPLQGSGQRLVVSAGEFVIFYPQDAHLPSREVETNHPQPVLKIVVKVPVI